MFLNRSTKLFRQLQCKFRILRAICWLAKLIRKFTIMSQQLDSQLHSAPIANGIERRQAV